MKRPTRNHGGSRMPLAVTFEKWAKEFNRGLVVGTLVWRAFQKFITAPLAVFEEEKPRFPSDKRKSLLFFIYEMTAPMDMPDNVRKGDAYSRAALEKVIATIDGYTKHLRKAGAVLLSNDGSNAMNITPVLQVLEEAAEISRVYIACLQHHYVGEARYATGVDCCLHFLAILKNNGFSEKQAYALARLALTAHDYHEPDLMYLESNIRAGTMRKRLKTFQLNAKQSYLVHEEFRRRAWHKNQHRYPYTPFVFPDASAAAARLRQLLSEAGISASTASITTPE